MKKTFLILSYVGVLASLALFIRAMEIHIGLWWILGAVLVYSLSASYLVNRIAKHFIKLDYQ